MGVDIIVIITISAISIYAFSNPAIIEKLQFNAWKVIHNKEYYRLISHGAVHGGWMHLIINMYVLYIFARASIILFYRDMHVSGELYFLILFVTAIPTSSIYSVFKEKNNYNYNAVGASGGVTAIVFATIFFEPFLPLRFIFIPIDIPGIVFGILYLVYSKYMSRKNIDNIGHDAHFWGAVYGFVFPILFKPVLAKEFIVKIISIFS